MLGNMSSSKLACYYRKKKMPRSYLPEDLITQILCKMPIKSIVTCTVVCKKWYSLIKNPTFIQTHFHNNKKDNNGLISCLETIGYRGGLHCCLHFNSQDFNDCLHLPLPPCCGRCRALSWTDIMGSCNGLLLALHCHGQDFFGDDLCFLWNPKIRKSLFPPRPISLFPENSLQNNCDFGLGFDSGADDYKMLAVVKSLGSDFSLEQLSIGFQLYSLDANSWKIINSVDHDYKGVEFDPLAFAFVSGFLHIIGFQRIASKNDINAGGDDSTSNKFYNFIVAFDVGKETFAKILLPESLAHANPYLCSIWAYRDSSIAVAEYNLLVAQYNLWMMGKYELEDSWTKLVIKDELPNCRVFYFLAFRNNGELIVRRTCGETEAAKFCRRHILM